MSLRSHARVLIRNAGLNLLTQIWLILVFLFTTPVVVHRLGDAAYGVLSLTLVVLGFFVFLNLGLNHAVVKFVSDHLARGEAKDVRRVASTCLIVNLVLGVIGAALIAALAPLFVSGLFNIPEPLQETGRRAFYLLAISFPFVLVQNTLQGIAGALQRFGLVSIVQGAAGALQGILPAGLLLLGFGLIEVVLAHMLVRILSCVAYALLLVRILPEFRAAPSWHGATFRKLMGFSSWLIVSGMVWPILMSSDRVLIGMLLSAEAVTFYAVPFGIASRLLIFSASMAPVLFPAFSERVATLNIAAVRSLLLKSAGMLFCVLAPIVLLLIILSNPILSIWMGEAYGREGSAVLQILAASMLPNALAAIPIAALLGLGRTDIIAKIQILELPVYVALGAILIPRMGIAGAATAWLVRTCMDMILMYGAVWRLVGAPGSAATEARAG
ncbi:MAG: flippase [Planctomycetota bacterium]|nr:flippase [Planctomycetota bacterium]